MMLPMLVSSAQRLPWPSCSMPNLVGKACVNMFPGYLHQPIACHSSAHACTSRKSLLQRRGHDYAHPPTTTVMVTPPQHWKKGKKTPEGTASSAPMTYTWPVSWATTNAEEKPSSWLRVQLRSGWHIPVTGAYPGARDNGKTKEERREKTFERGEKK